MSFLSNLNPFKWVKELLISDYVGAPIRHAITAFGAILLAHKFGTDAVVGEWVRATIALVTSSEFLVRLLEVFTGLGTILGGLAASVKNKKVP